MSESLHGSMPSIDNDLVTLSTIDNKEEGVNTPTTTSTAATTPLSSTSMKERKLRKRLNMIESERKTRSILPHFPTKHSVGSNNSGTPTRPTKSTTSKDLHELEMTTVDHLHPDGILQNENLRNVSVSDMVSDMRRRRVFQSHHRRPFPTATNNVTPTNSNNPSSATKHKKKKIKFWDETTTTSTTSSLSLSGTPTRLLSKHKLQQQHQSRLYSSSSPFRHPPPPTAAEIVRQRFQEYTLRKTMSEKQQESNTNTTSSLLSDIPVVVRKSPSLSSYNNTNNYADHYHHNHNNNISVMSSTLEETTTTIPLPRVLWNEDRLQSSSTITATNTNKVTMTSFSSLLSNHNQSNVSSHNRYFNDDSNPPIVIIDDDNNNNHLVDGSHPTNPRNDLSKDEIMDGMVYEEDEIMTPIKVQNDNNVLSIFNKKKLNDGFGGNTIEGNEEEEGQEVPFPTTTTTSQSYIGNPNSFAYISPTPLYETPQKNGRSNETTVGDLEMEVDPAAFTPPPPPNNREGNRPSNMDGSSLQSSSTMMMDGPYSSPSVTTWSRTTTANTVTPPNAPRKEIHYSKFHHLDPSDSDMDDDHDHCGVGGVAVTDNGLDDVPQSSMSIVDCSPLIRSPIVHSSIQRLIQPELQEDKDDEDKFPSDCSAIEFNDNPIIHSKGSIVLQSLCQDDDGYYNMNDIREGHHALNQQVANTIEARSTMSDDNLANGAVSSLKRDGGSNDVDGTEKNTVKLFVDQYNKATYEQILDNLRGLSSVKTLVVCRSLDPSAMTYRTQNEMKEFLTCVRSIENLESLMLLNFGPETLMDLAMTLNNHPSIYRVQIHMADGTLSGEMLGVLATSPTITHVQVEVKESCAIGTLTNSRSLQSLQFTSDSIRLEKSHLRTLIYGLQFNHVLTSLDLAPTISAGEFRTLCQALKENDRLECLRISLKIDNDDDSESVATDLAFLFRSNTTLMTVWNFSHDMCHMDEHSRYIILSSLRRSSTMRQFRFFSDEFELWSPPPAEIDKSIEGDDDTELDDATKTTDDESTKVERSKSAETSYQPEELLCFDSEFCDPIHSIECLQDIGEAFRKLTGNSDGLSVL